MAPLGVVLPAGLGLRIDGADVGNVKFLKCWKFGCLAEVIDTDGALVSRILQRADGELYRVPHPKLGHRLSGAARRLRRGVEGPELSGPGNASGMR